MTKSNYSLSASLRQDICDVITSELHLPTAAVLQYKIIYDDDRRIYKIKVEGRQEFFVLKVRGLKVVKQQDHDIEDLKKEYRLLEDAWNSAKNMPPNFGMSKPIKLWIPEKAMLLSGCEGTNFNDWFNRHIFKWTFQSSELKSAIHQIGVWLGSYHDYASDSLDLAGQFSNRAENLERMLTFLKTNQRHNLSEEKLDSLQTLFNQLVAQEQQGPVAQVHGNFAYRNILYSSSQINLVDFEDAHNEHVAFDIGQFTAEIMFKSQFPWLRHLTKQLTKSFTEGYQQNFSLQPSVTAAYLGYHLIVHLYEHCSRKKPSGLAGLVLNYRIRYLSKLILRWCKKEAS